MGRGRNFKVVWYNNGTQLGEDYFSIKFNGEKLNSARSIPPPENPNRIIESVRETYLK